MSVQVMLLLRAAYRVAAVVVVELRSGETGRL
jgi:hypothetical protein